MVLLLVNHAALLIRNAQAESIGTLDDRVLSGASAADVSAEGALPNLLLQELMVLLVLSSVLLEELS